VRRPDAGSDLQGRSSRTTKKTTQARAAAEPGGRNRREKIASRTLVSQTRIIGPK
jgi:hypothetical protein